MLERIRQRPAAICFFWAIVFHLFAITSMFFIRVASHFENPEENLRHFRVRSVTAAPAQPKSGRMTSPQQFARSLKFIGSNRVNSLRPLEEVRTPLPQPKASPLRRSQEGPSKNTSLVAPTVIEEHELKRLVSESEERSLKDTISDKKMKTSSVKSELDKLRESSHYKTAAASFMTALQKPLESLDLYAPKNVDLDPEEGMPGFTPQAHAGDASGNVFLKGAAVSVPAEQLSRYEPLDAFLDIEVLTYENPGDDRNYFMVRIFPKKGVQSFRVMSKEILFAIDCSLSISPDRLEELKQGIIRCLSSLNPDDLFNIVAFKDETFLFSAQPIKATPASIEKAGQFVAGLTPSNQTDVYAAVRSIVEKPLNREPSNILLLSDGKPTHGIVDARELLASITRINGKTRPVFVFSGGAKVNRYLLDFIAYQNRGWSEFIKNTPDIDRGLLDFYKKIKDPIFLRLRYRFNGLEEEGIFPKSLPDFYKNAEFTLYGSYAGEDVFSMQLLGDVEGKTKELIFSRSLKEARPGGPAVMKGYAFNKIYHLINRVTIEGNKPELLQEIRSLSQRYGIQTPYSPELQNID